MDNLISYEIFVYVVECGGITGAARALNLSKAAISRTIKLLEQEAKIDLFYRQNRGLQLTPIGQELYQQSKRVQAELNDTRSYLNRLQQKPKGVLRIAVPSYIIETLLMTKLEKFLNDHPDLIVEFDNTEALINFNDRQHDLAFGYSIISSDELITRKTIAKTRYVICASPNYFKRFGKPKKLQDLAKHRYIAHTMREAHEVLDMKKNKDNFTMTPQLKLNNAKEMIVCALHGLGIIQAHHFMVREHLETGKLIEVLTNYTLEDVPLYLYYKKFRFAQPKMRAFIDYFCMDYSLD